MFSHTLQKEYDTLKELRGKSKLPSTFFSLLPFLARVYVYPRRQIGLVTLLSFYKLRHETLTVTVTEHETFFSLTFNSLFRVYVGVLTIASFPMVTRN